MADAPIAAVLEAAKVHHRGGRLAEAERLYRAVLERDPENHDCLHRLGILAHQCGDSSNAELLVRGAISLRGDVAPYYNHHGIILQALGRSDLARASYARAIELAPDLAEAHNNLGNLLLASDRPDEAIAYFRCALALAPAAAEISYNLGNALRRAGDASEAAIRYRNAIALQPDHAEAHVNLGLLLLAEGLFAEGGAEYEWRWKLRPPISPLRRINAPDWDGSPLPDGTLLVHAEQGLGDTIQFCRFVVSAAERCERILLEVPSSLKRLLAPLYRYGAVISHGDPLPNVDAHCALVSLPWRLAVTRQILAPEIPYLSAEPDRVAVWRRKVPKDGLRIGIAWQGNPAARFDRHRSIPLAAFRPLADIPGVHLISLQKHHGLDQMEELPGLTVLAPEFDDGPSAFVDTAAVMESLDLIVTCDTAVAHLAGALGRPVWVALDKTPDWRWQLGGDDSPWYPTMRLFRQSVAGDWQTPFGRIAEQLRWLPHE